jgi:protein gp37
MAHRFCNHFLTEDGVKLIEADGKFTGCIFIHSDRLSIPLKRRKPTVFAVWNDLFHEKVPDEFREETYDAMNRADRHTYLILTKRPQNMERYVSGVCHAVGDYDVSRDHVWHGLTVCNQEEMESKSKDFFSVPVKKFFSLEPMLSKVIIPPWVLERKLLDSVILGGESGPGARPMHPDWVRSVRDQCAAAGVSFFFKSWGKYIRRNGDYYPIKKGWPHRLLDGRTHDDLPWHKVKP